MTAIQEFPEVQDATLDSKTWKVQVTFNSKTPDTEGLIAHFDRATDFTLAVISEGQDRHGSIDTTGLDIETISKRGEDVAFGEHLAVGKTTIVDFYADWCVPCKVLEAKLVERMRNDDGIALRKVNIFDWDSAVANKYLNEAEGIPYVIIYDGSGAERYRGTGLIERIDEALALAKSFPAGAGESP